MYNIYLFAIIITKIVQTVVIVDAEPNGRYHNNCYFIILWNVAIRELILQVYVDFGLRRDTWQKQGDMIVFGLYKSDGTISTVDEGSRQVLF